MSFAKNLDHYLTEHKLSNYRISKDTRISDSLIGYWRKGEKLPSLENLMTLCKYLNVPVDYLLGTMSQEEWDVLEFYRSLTPKEREEFLCKISKNIRH